jgi:uncharacterized protein YoxC
VSKREVLCQHCSESGVYTIFNIKQGKKLLHKTNEEIKESLSQKLKSLNNPRNALQKFTKSVTSAVVRSYKFTNVIAMHHEPSSNADHIPERSCRFFTGIF